MGMQAAVIPQRDVRHLDRVLLDNNGNLRLVESAVYATIDPIDLRVWCHSRAIYGLPTAELIGWLRGRIAGRTAIEIGAGAGTLGRFLGIPMTDSYIQRDDPTIVAYYRLAGQPTVQYGKDVEKLEASAAVAKYRPQVVIGSWITEYVAPGATPGPGGGSMKGIREDQILAQVEAYIVVGNLGIHGAKTLCAKPHEILHAPWIRSRSATPEKNCILMWENRARLGVEP